MFSFTPYTILPKSISTLLILVFIANLALFAVIFHPEPVEAGILTTVVADVTAAIDAVWKAAKLVWEKSIAAKDALYKTWDQFKSSHGVIAEAISLTFAIAMHQILAKMTNDIMAWINGGYRGKPKVMTDFRSFLEEGIDEAGGILMGAITGLDPKTLCDASWIKLKLAPAFSGPYAIPTFGEKVQCTFSGMADGLRRFKEDFRNGGWQSFVQYAEKQNNQLGQTMIVAEEAAKIESKEAAKRMAEITAGKGYLAQKKCYISKVPEGSPSSWQGKELGEVFKTAGGGFWNEQQGEAVNEFNNLYEERRVYDDITGQETIIPKSAQWDQGAFNQYYGSKVSQMGNTGFGSIEEFKGMIISSGGEVDCKIVTPAEDIAALSNKALMAPIEKLQGAVDNLMSKMGTGMGGVLKPYVMAISATVLNDLLQREKGLVASVFTRPPKSRKNIRQNTGALQSNAMLAQSAGATAGSVNDFRSFLLKAAIDFNQYIGNIGRVMDKSDVLGRTQINKVEFDTMGGVYQPASSGVSLQRQVLNLEYGPTNTDVPLKSPGRELAGWLANVDCATSTIATEGVLDPSAPDFGDENGNGLVYSETTSSVTVSAMDMTLTIPIPPTFYVHQIIKPVNSATTTVPIAECKIVSGEVQPTQKIYTTYSAGKTFYNEAKWCGAYSQELPIPFASEREFLEPMSDAISTSDMNMCGSSSCPTKSMVYTGVLTPPNWALNTYEGFNLVGYLTGNLAYQISHNIEGPPLGTGGDLEMEVQIYRYDDNSDGEPDRFIRISSVGEDTSNPPDNIPDASPNVPGAHLFAETLIHSYIDLNGDGVINKISGNADATIYKEVMPLFDDTSDDRNNLIQPAGASTATTNYAFGGYNQFGFSNLIRNASTGAYISKLPIRLAGAQAVYFPPNGRIYIFGGMNYDGFLDTVFEFNPLNGSIRGMSAKLPEKTTGLSGAYFSGTGKIYLFGGSTASGVKNWVLEYNQQTDTMVRMNAALPVPTVHSAAVVSSPSAGQQRIYIIGGKDQNGLAQSSIIEYNPRGEDNGLTAVIEKRAKTVPRAYHAAYLKSSPKIEIYGGQNENGLVANKEEYDPINDSIKREILPSAEHRSQMGFTANGTLTGGIKRDDASQLYPQGDIYYIPQKVDAMNTREFMWQKYFSSKFENGSVSLMNFKESIIQKDSTATILDPYTHRETNTNSDEIWMAPPFYPEMLEDAQELMEKVRVIRGYNYNKPWARNYTAALPLQLGAIPDDDPTDNRLSDYEGSVSDVLSRYSELNKIYQTLFSGVTDESALEGVDPNMTWLTPEETNIKLALIGQRCPAIQPTATSSPDLIAKCPPLGAELGSEYNMQKRFVFEPDGFDTKQSITTGFATNPFNNKKSSSLAGVLNLDEMATQLQTAQPDTNLVKLIRLRQVLEQLQVPINSAASSATVPILLAGKNKYISPKTLSNVDIIQMDTPGYERIQEYLNDTKTRNLDIQTLIEAYGYTTAKEAYPEISKDLDNVWQDIVNQVTDKLKDVFLKRTEKELETARAEAQNRLTKFIEYVEDLNANVKYEYDTNESGRIGGLIDNLDKEHIKTYSVSSDTDVLEINAMMLFKNPAAMDVMLARDSQGIPRELSLSNDDRNAIIGTAAYKIRSLAKFIGIDISSEQFGSRMSQYTSDVSGNPLALDARVKNILKDVYLYYSGIYNFTDPLLISSSDRTITALPVGAELLDNPPPIGCDVTTAANYNGYQCNLTTYEKSSTTVRRTALNKDAKTKLHELTEDFNLMLAEVDAAKAEYQDLSGKVKERGDSMDEMANLLSALEADYDKANACIGMPTDPGNLWKFHSGRVLGYSLAAITGTFALVAGFNIAAISLGVGYLTIGIALPVIGVIGLAIAAFYGNKKKKKAEKKYRKQVAKIANDCKQGIRDYNKHLGQLADLFLCNQQNPIYKDDAGQ